MNSVVRYAGDLLRPGRRKGKKVEDTRAYSIMDLPLGSREKIASTMTVAAEAVVARAVAVPGARGSGSHAAASAAAAAAATTVVAVVAVDSSRWITRRSG